MVNSHTTLAKCIHWGFIILYAYGMFKQLDDLSQLEDTGLLIFEVIFASIFLLIVIIRYAYMRRFETFLGAREQVHIVHTYFAKIVHKSMYLCLILLPLSGLAIAGLFVRGVTDGPIQGAVLAIHESTATLSYVLIAIHVSAAIYSRIKGEGIWSSMVPILKEEKPTENQIIKKISAFEEGIYDKVQTIFSSNKE